MQSVAEAVGSKEATADNGTAVQTVLVLRTCKPDLTSHGGFQWPGFGTVECSDWNAEPRCGNGLHGLLWGEGDGDLLNWSPEAKWLVVQVQAADVVVIGGKVKFPRGVVLFSGDRKGATEFIQANGASGKAIVGGTATAGYAGTATAGDDGTATAGDDGTATAGERGVLQIKYWDNAAQRYRVATGYVGEDGIQPNTAYQAVNGKLSPKVSS